MRCTRARLGFSLLDVVERNPTELRLADGRVLRHPDGVLARTELTQPALVTLHAAQLAELREAGALGDDGVLAAGHSAGEFSALVALGVLGLETALELVFARGELMQEHVARDADGASAYAMAVVDPSLAGFGLAELEAVVGGVGRPRDRQPQRARAPVRGRRYARCGGRARRAARARRRCALLPGIDVPFHSSLLAPAVEPLRAAARAARRRGRPPPPRRALDPERHRPAVRARCARGDPDARRARAAHRPAGAPARVAGAVGADAARAGRPAGGRRPRRAADRRARSGRRARADRAHARDARGARSRRRGARAAARRERPRRRARADAGAGGDRRGGQRRVRPRPRRSASN